MPDIIYPDGRGAGLQNTTCIKDEIKPLTGLRGFAAIWVFLLHACFGNVNTFGYFPAFDHKIDFSFMENFILQGYLAVDLFFVLSGFIIAYTYANDFHGVISVPALKNFFVKRVARIYPVHAFLTLLLAAAYFSGVWDTVRPMTMEDVILSLTLLNVLQEPSVNIPAWSISAEWFAYLAAPPILIATARSNKIAINLILLAALCILYPLLFHKFFCCSGIVGAGAILRVLSGFTAGVLLYRLYRQNFLRAGSTMLPDIMGACALIGIFTLAHLEMHFSLIYPFLILFVYTLAVCRSYLQTIFASRVMLFLGAISYCIYMVHYPVLEIFSLLLSDYLYETDAGQGIYWAILAAMTAALIGAASLLYFLIEKPARGWIARICLRG